MSTRALHIHMESPIQAADHETITVSTKIIVGFDDQAEISDTLHADIGLKTLGLYRTALQMNVAIVEAVKDYMLATFGIATNGYAATYLYGGLT